ncbi:hypothetical protein [Kineococcus rhizosphaerae]|uniref:TcpE family protein n=1 Tax=Kineococcus rhizosphaerae TaxID=559628 RepID=A0A2T0QWT0_9ACTN|nr:hypothetical protein [Kineococcus rhizosphaerae]PRY09922.1 hypothetical protein CLV37_11930 [Kineococcus rhizosphaerae]
MSIEQLPPHVRVTRFYTAVRRIPTLVGKLPNGGFIPGGPYTLGQVAVMLLVAVGGFYTMPWWGGGQGANLGNFIKLALAVVLTSMASSKLRWRGRQVLPALRGAVYSYTHGSQPRQGGRTPTGTGPQRLRTNILIIEELPAPATRALAPDPRAQKVEGTFDPGSEVGRSNLQPTRKRPLTTSPTASATASPAASAVAAPARAGAPARRQSPAAASASLRIGARPRRTLHAGAAAAAGASTASPSPGAPTAPRRPAPGSGRRQSSSSDRDDRNEVTELVELVNTGGGR